MYAISQGISNLEDVKVLVKEETEKAVKVGVSGSEMPLVYPFSNIDKSLAPIVD